MVLSTFGGVVKVHNPINRGPYSSFKGLCMSLAKPWLKLGGTQLRTVFGGRREASKIKEWFPDAPVLGCIVGRLRLPAADCGDFLAIRHRAPWNWS